VVYDRKPHEFNVRDVARIIQKLDLDKLDSEEILTSAALMFTVYLKLLSLTFRKVGINLSIAWQLWGDFLNLFLTLRGEVLTFFATEWEGMKKQLKGYLD